MSISDGWRTPEWLFDELNKEFGFDTDLAAIEENSKCGVYAVDYLNDSYQDKLTESDPSTYNSVSTMRDLCNLGIDQAKFLNPPYSNPKPFIRKAWDDSKHCKIVCLVKCDPSTRWWATFWNYVPRNGCMSCYDKDYMCQWCKEQGIKSQIVGPKPGCEVRFFPKRINFDPPLEMNCIKHNGKWWQPWNCPDKSVRFIEEYGGWYKPLSGSAFSCALLIFDRREI